MNKLCIITAFSAGFGILSCGHASVSFNGKSYISIEAALGTAPKGNPSLTLTGDDKSEHGNMDLSGCKNVTVVSNQSGTNRTISTSAANTSLFADSSTGALTLSDLSVSGFSNDGTSYTYGGAIDAGNMVLQASGPVTFSGNRVTGEGQCGGALNADGHLDFSGTGTVTFIGNTATGTDVSGGAVCVGNLTTTGKGKLVFENNSANDTDSDDFGAEGGAIYANTLNLSGPSTFTNNQAISKSKAISKGGAIYSNDGVTLTDAQFSGNLANIGGAVYLADANAKFTYTISSGNTITLGQTTGTTSGDNDIACASSTDMFIKDGPGTLVLNTKNSGWRGSTSINAGTFTVGDRLGNGAVWGPTSSVTTFKIASGATLGGYGTINALNLTFDTKSTWLLNPGGAGLTVGNTLTLDPKMTIQLGVLPTSFPSVGYIVATYKKFNMTSITSPADIANALNKVLTNKQGQNLQLTASEGKLLLQKLTSVSFKVHAETKWGENIYLTGSGSALGNWNQANALPMSCVGTYPYWTVTVPISGDLSQTQYSYIKQQGTKDKDPQQLGRGITLSLASATPHDTWK